ncbi:MAG: hypothetical protein PQJ60_13730 [Spirochaetales bacterium]|nr:hypothetical protein [Spirochaetales bacterium]
MKHYNRPALIPVVLLLLTVGCQSVEERLDPPDYTAILPSEAPEVSVDLPLPQLVLSYYLPPPILPLHEELDLPLPLPAYRGEGAVVMAAPVEEEEKASPVVTPSPPPAEEKSVDSNERSQSSSRSESSQTVAPTREREEENEQAAPLREESFPAGEAALVVLEGTDWLYLREKEGEKVNFSDRTVMDGQTLFSFKFPQEGQYILVFQRQDFSTGDSEQEEILVHATEPASEPQLSSALGVDDSTGEEGAPLEPSFEEREETASDLPVSDVSEEKQSPSQAVSAAVARLEEIEENPDKVEETLDLLEFLMDAASDDEELAGYYYRLARTLEMNTRFQDLRKAYEIYGYIEDTFFLTDYYDLAVDRLRYLDRHFFKLR